MDSKGCITCKQSRPLSDYGKYSRAKDGLQSQCKECNRKYHQAYRDSHPGGNAKRSAEWRERNLDVARAKVIAFNKANPQRMASYTAAYRKRHPDRRKASCASYRLKNPDKEKQSRREWCRKNMPHLCAKSAARRAYKLRATPSWSEHSEIQAIYERARRISLETGIEYHVDHIVPLKSDIVCGLHCLANLQILEGRENLSKNNRRWPQMPAIAA